LKGEVSLRIPSKKDISIENFSLEIEKNTNHGELFVLKRYMTRARITKPSKIMILDAEKFLHIIRDNKSEFAIMTYLAKVYFQRYVNTMKELEEHTDNV